MSVTSEVLIHTWPLRPLMLRSVGRLAQSSHNSKACCRYAGRHRTQYSPRAPCCRFGDMHSLFFTSTAQRANTLSQFSVVVRAASHTTGHFLISHECGPSEIWFASVLLVGIRYITLFEHESRDVARYKYTKSPGHPGDSRTLANNRNPQPPHGSPANIKQILVLCVEASS